MKEREKLFQELQYASKLKQLYYDDCMKYKSNKNVEGKGDLKVVFFNGKNTKESKHRIDCFV